MKEIFDKLSPHILEHLESRKDSMSIMVVGETTSEEWFRIELCAAIQKSKDVVLASSNRAGTRNRERPDFVLNYGNDRKLLELKVLPIDKNYSNGWQRFQAGANNKKDFKNLEAGRRAGVIYIHWPCKADWQKVRGHIEGGYRVSCCLENEIVVGNSTLSLSYWERCYASEFAKKSRHLTPTVTAHSTPILTP